MVGIIGLLISMLIPSLKRTMRLAASTVCMHNLVQIGNSLTMYRVDSDGWLPTDLATDDASEAGTVAGMGDDDAWFQRLYPTYMSDLLVMTCPEDPYRYQMEEAIRRWDDPSLKQHPDDPDIGDCASYGINGFIMTAGGGKLADLDRHPAKRPLDTILVTDLGPDSLRIASNRASSSGSGKTGMRREGAVARWDDGYDPLVVQEEAPWVTRRHGHGINMLTVANGVRSARTVDVMRESVRVYYEDCAAGGCALCNRTDPSRPFIYHCSFAKDRLFWWTGSTNVD